MSDTMRADARRGDEAHEAHRERAEAPDRERCGR
jgi:hypothetical protein